MTKLSDGTVISSAYRRTGVDIGQGFEHVKKLERLKVGTIIAVRNVDSTQGLQKSADNTSEGTEGTPYETVYDVRIDDNNARPFIFNGCRALKPFMGANNYFEVIHEGADQSATYVESVEGPVGGVLSSAASSLMGARCVVLCIEGSPTAPVILGFLQHPARVSTITKDKKLHLEFEFNGFKASIDKDGALLIESNGPFIPTITSPVGIGKVPEGIIRANPLAGPFTINLTKDMQFILQDNMGQMISIDRSAMKMEITNGAESITLIKSLIPTMGEMLINVGGAMTIGAGSGVYGFDKSFELSTLDLKINADVSTAIKTGNMDFKAEFGFSVESLTIALVAKIAFAAEATTFSFKGKTGELLALIYELVDNLGKCTPASPVGPCAPIMASPQYAAVLAALVKLKTMTG